VFRVMLKYLSIVMSMCSVKSYSWTLSFTVMF